MTGTLSMARILAISATLCLISSSACKIETTLCQCISFNSNFKFLRPSIFQWPPPTTSSEKRDKGRKLKQKEKNTTQQQQRAENIRTSSKALRMSS